VPLVRLDLDSCRVQGEKGAVAPPSTTPRAGSLTGELIIRGGLAYGRAYSALWSRLERARVAVGTFLHEALSDAERAQMVHRLFARLESYGPEGLHAWEELWYQRDLPSAPARVLIGGCGGGRELAVLHARGYTVHGFEPSASLACAARRSLPEDRVWTLSYEDLLCDEASAPVVAHAPYDAVILGWGSVAHVLDGATRERVLELLSRLAPRGPLLLSFPFLFGTHTGHAQRWRAPAECLGKSLRRWRGLPDAATEPEEFLPHAGFVHCFSERELANLAKKLGRVLRWGERSDAYPHCSLLAPAARLEPGP
jgi:SAM-dependent methyltransferase